MRDTSHDSLSCFLCYFFSSMLLSVLPACRPAYCLVGVNSAAQRSCVRAVQLLADP